MIDKVSSKADTAAIDIVYLWVDGADPAWQARRAQAYASWEQTQPGMLALHKAGFRILLQVHDEVAVSVQDKDAALEAARIMKEAVSLEVPSKVDTELGPSWGEARG